MMTILSTHDLNIGYRNTSIAEDINLTIQDNEIIGLLGINGVGKSTFFKTILNIIKPLSGQIFLKGKNIKNLKPNQLVSMVGYIPQNQKYIVNFEVNDFVLMGRAARIGLFSQPSLIDYEITEYYLELMKISHLKKRLFNELSGGEQQLVLITRCLVQEPNLLLMDEPTASLDFRNQILVLESILRLREIGYSVIFSTHQPTQIPLIADRLLIMNNRHLKYHENPAQFINIENMAMLYGVDASQVQKYMRI